MLLRSLHLRFSVLFLVALTCAIFSSSANAASCKTQSQMTPAQRESLSNAARSMITDVQSGDVQHLRANTIPAVAADFDGIAASAAT